MPKKKNASSLISELKRKTRRTYSSEEKIRIVLEGLKEGYILIINKYIYQ